MSVKRSGDSRPGVSTTLDEVGKKPYTRSPTATPGCVDCSTRAKPQTGTKRQASSPVGKKRQ